MSTLTPSIQLLILSFQSETLPPSLKVNKKKIQCENEEK